MEVLRDAGITSALVHGGTSTVYALGHPPDAEYWKVAVENPPASVTAAAIPLPPVLLKDEAMSVSAIWGRSFQKEGQIFGHVLDPHTGNPAASAVLAAVILPSATETDALSTALLTLGSEGHDKIAKLRAWMRTFLMLGADEQFRVETRNM
jgi:thiamine biosynthesis lipoprotein